MRNLILGILFTTILSGHGIAQKTYSKDILNKLLIRANTTHSNAIVIYKDGKLLTEQYFNGGNAQEKIELMSCTKSVVGLAVACLLSDGLIENIDVPIYHYYPEWNQGTKKEITLRHLVNMTSGIQNNPNATVEIYPSPDFVKLALAAELSNKPGDVFSYNNKSLNLMAGLILKITGKRMDLYIAERLFKPLQITDYTWSMDQAGNPHVMAGCQLNPMDFAKLGLVIINEGQYDGKKIITTSALAQMLEPSKQYAGYAMLWWIDYENNISIVDDEIINSLKTAGLDDEFITKVRLIKGVYKSDNDFVQKLRSVFGDNLQYVREKLGKLQLRKREFSGNITYRADGYLGNYMIIDPGNKLIAVRLISYLNFKSEEDNFTDFKELVLKL